MDQLAIKCFKDGSDSDADGVDVRSAGKGQGKGAHVNSWISGNVLSLNAATHPFEMPPV